jgi:hypothetical protein
VTRSGGRRLRRRAAWATRSESTGSRFDLEQFRGGMDVEFEHGSHDSQTDVTGDDPILTGKIALAHMSGPAFSSLTKV